MTVVRPKAGDQVRANRDILTLIGREPLAEKGDLLTVATLEDGPRHLIPVHHPGDRHWFACAPEELDPVTETP